MSEAIWTLQDGGDARVEAALQVAGERGRLVRPALLQVVGVSVGGCVVALDTGRLGAMRRSGHAHTSNLDPLRGWLCFKSPNVARIVTPGGKPTRLLWHEWAHVYGRAGHTERWRDLLVGVGQPAEARTVSARRTRP